MERNEHVFDRRDETRTYCLRCKTYVRDPANATEKVDGRIVLRKANPEFCSAPPRMEERAEFEGVNHAKGR